MDIYRQGNWCFVKYRQGGMIAIGTNEEVENADIVELSVMILSAIAISEYRAIETVKGLVLH